MLITAYFLKHEGMRGSVFYCGERVGRGGHLFRCWKFRTMDPGSEYLLYDYLEENPDAKKYWERYFKLPDDPRVRTRTARIIRKLSIDELPQLWNVIKGDMSLVGPRPILSEEIEAYGDRISEYYMVRPGVTGLWQASGRSNTSFQRRVLWDTWYVRNWSLWGDIVIIFKTLKSVIRGSGAF
jgi:undecaprenyl-phosphate galactose phosphotransferase